MSSNIEVHHLIPLEHVGLHYAFVLDVSVAENDSVQLSSYESKCLSELLLNLVGLSEVQSDWEEVPALLELWRSPQLKSLVQLRGVLNEHYHSSS